MEPQQQQQQQALAAHHGAFTHFQQQQQQQHYQHEDSVGPADFMDDGGSVESTPGPVASTSKGGTSMVLKEKRASGAGGSSKKGTKRPRPTLSCTECVRRKSKCDRVIPCSTCIKRGSPDRCRVDDDLDRPSQPFAQARELALVKERVSKLEQLLLAIAPEKAKAMLDGNAGQHSAHSSKNHADSSMSRAGGVSGNDSEMDEEDEGEEGGEAEKAAFALESIAVAGRNPMSFEAGGDMDALPLTSQAKLRESQLRQQEVDFLMSMLPDWNLSRDLVDAFFNKVAWQNHIVHVPTFEAQYSGLRELVDQRRISEIDPAWLSLYFMVLACGMFFSPNRSDMPASHQAEYTHTWVLGAQRALQLADWSGRPQLTCIQSVVLLPVVLMHAGGIKRLSSWIAAAMRMAQLLDLHKLDDKNAAVRRSGAAAGFTPVEREIGKRLYFSLAHGEVNFASRWLGIEDSQSSHPSSIPNLLNVDDTDLLASPPIPKSIEVATASSFQVIRARITTQDFNARLTGSDARVHKYESVLAFDQRTRQLLESLPAYFKYDRSDDPDIKAIAASRPYIAYQRCVILYGLNNRLLRAHRPFMSRGYYDQKFAYSTDCCIKAAKVIIAAQRALRDIFDAADRMYNCLLYCFSSAVVLLVDNFHRLSAPGAMSGTSELDAQRHEALDVLLMLRREANTSMIAQAGTKVLEGLLNEEGKRRTGRGLPSPSEDFTRNNTPDNDPPTLREVVERIASVSRSKSAVPGSVASGNSASGSPTTPAFPHKQLPSPRGTSFPSTAPMLNGYPIPPIKSEQQGPSAFVPSQIPPVNLDLPPTQSFMNAGGFGESLMSGDESEDLLRSLGFFEVSGNVLPSMNDGSESAGYGTMLGGNAGMAQDLSWLDGLGEW